MIPDLIFALTAVNSYLTGPACLWETTWPLDGILTTVTWKEMKRNSELIPYNSKEPNNKKKPGSYLWRHVSRHQMYQIN